MCYIYILYMNHQNGHLLKTSSDIHLTSQLVAKNPSFLFVHLNKSMWALKDSATWWNLNRRLWLSHLLKEKNSDEFLVGVFCRKICCLLFVGNLGSKIICQIKWRFHWDWSCLPNLVYPTSTFTFYPTLRIMDFKWFQYTKSQRSGNWNWIHVYIYIYTKSPNLKDQYIPCKSKYTKVMRWFNRILTLLSSKQPQLPADWHPTRWWLTPCERTSSHFKEPKKTNVCSKETWFHDVYNLDTT